MERLLGLGRGTGSVVELSGRTVNCGCDNDCGHTSEAISADPAGNNGTVGYSYDAVGNRTQMTSTLNAIPPGSFSYDANDQLTTDTYDANGNTISSRDFLRLRLREPAADPGGGTDPLRRRRAGGQPNMSWCP